MSESKKKSFVETVKEHKWELFAAGPTVAGLLLCGSGLNDLCSQKRITVREEFRKTTDVVVKRISESLVDCAVGVSDTVTYPVVGHVRALPGGWNASAEKIATAAENGFSLCEHQTWVIPHERTRVA